MTYVKPGGGVTPELVALMPSGYTPLFCAWISLLKMKQQIEIANRAIVKGAAFLLPVFTLSLGLKISEPAESAQPWHEAIFTTASDDKLRDALKTLS